MENNPKISFIKAFQKAQKEFPSMGKTKEVNQGSFGYSYLPLEKMLSLVTPVLLKHKFHLSQGFSHTQTGQTILVTKLVHEDGHEEKSELPLFLPEKDMQKKNQTHVWGGSVTYERRYSIKLILGLETDMDLNMEDEKVVHDKQTQSEPSVTEMALKWIQKAPSQKHLNEIKKRLDAQMKEGNLSDSERHKLTNAIVQKETSLL